MPSAANVYTLCLSYWSVLDAHLVLAKPDSAAVAWLRVLVAKFPSLHHVHLCLAWVKQAAQLSDEGKAGRICPWLLHRYLKAGMLGRGKLGHGHAMQ